ncbi:TRAP transporter small permease [Thalassotalea litorea]|uniref:TRAP transporter small permease protein n=1 Tax=Thalassotalea litorea TaxID=2020715 RepID=A0A5R9IHQ5_9GAMM|nr:TRAP transporter small permease [Thalassotalea litorea]TLU59482.1 TRAP transporter small permease [Thalassotalea litorea]
MWFSNAMEKLGQQLNRLVVLLLVLLIVDVSWQVLTRFILPQPSSFTEEVARFLLIWISLLGAAVAYRYKDHLGFDLLAKKLPKKHQAKVSMFNAMVTIVFAVFVLLIGGGNVVYVVYTLEQYSSVLGVNMVFVYMVIPFAGLLFLMFAIDNLIQLSAPSEKPDGPGSVNHNSQGA